MEKDEKEIWATVDYTKNVNRTIIDGGYDKGNDDVDDNHFPVPSEKVGKKEKIMIKLFHYKRNVNSEYVIADMAKVNFRPATLMEMLSSGILFSELKSLSLIVALGSTCKDICFGPFSPCINKGYARCRLILGWFDDEWDPMCYFIGVRK